jgi:hypothetical protein
MVEDTPSTISTMKLIGLAAPTPRGPLDMAKAVLMPAC